MLGGLAVWTWRRLHLSGLLRCLLLVVEEEVFHRARIQLGRVDSRWTYTLRLLAVLIELLKKTTFRSFDASLVLFRLVLHLL